MSDVDGDDSLTKLNTQLNKSMVLMENDMENDMENGTPQHRRSKTIKINTKTQAASLAKRSSSASRKSILKKSSSERRSDEEAESNNQSRRLSSLSPEIPSSAYISKTQRPQTLQDLLQEEYLVPESSTSTFDGDLSDSEEIWIMDIPQTIDPHEFKGKTLVLGNKSKFKINEERYCAVNHDVNCSITCVLGTKKSARYKTVNIKPAGIISVRRKLSGPRKIKPMHVESTGVPFPENLKTRHPLFGVSYEGKVRKVEPHYPC